LSWIVTKTPHPVKEFSAAVFHLAVIPQSIDSLSIPTTPREISSPPAGGFCKKGGF
jgi:hypothetical protein